MRSLRVTSWQFRPRKRLNLTTKKGREADHGPLLLAPRLVNALEVLSRAANVGYRAKSRRRPLLSFFQYPPPHYRTFAADSNAGAA